MSGTSLDGLDLAFCEFVFSDNQWRYKLIKTALVKYPGSWRERLDNAFDLPAFEFARLDVDFGTFLGKQCASFIAQNKLRVDFISSHGHTIFHQPEKGFTSQIGNGNAIHAVTDLPVVCDFRSLDVIRGGEGAPLVPVGDKLLFHEYDICLNLGGIANLSAEINKARRAFDVCYCNMGLNYLVEQVGKKYDKGGMLAADGNVNEKLLSAFDKNYASIRKKRPSLGKERFLKDFKPLLDNKRIPLEDRLATMVESTAKEIARAAIDMKRKSMLCTGGGAFNAYLMSRILHHCHDVISIIIPEDEVVKYKEALVFAFLGVLRVSNQVNCLKSVTNATTDSSSGVMVGFKNTVA